MGVRLTTEEQALAASHVTDALRFARAISRDRPWLRDEAESEALVVLARIAAGFDPALGAFRSHLYGQIYRAFLNLNLASRSERRHRRRLTDADYDSLACPEPADDGPTRAERTRWAVSHLKGEQRQYIKARYGFDGLGGAGIHKAAARLGWGRSRAERVEREAFARIEALLNRADLKPNARPVKEWADLKPRSRARRCMRSA